MNDLRLEVSVDDQLLRLFRGEDLVRRPGFAGDDRLLKVQQRRQEERSFFFWPFRGT